MAFAARWFAPVMGGKTKGDATVAAPRGLLWLAESRTPVMWGVAPARARSGVPVAQRDRDRGVG